MKHQVEPWLCANFNYCLTSPLLAELPSDDPNSQWLQNFSATLGDDESQLTAEPNRRLGKWYENLWLALFNQHPDYDLIAHEQTILTNQRTQGAIDFLVADHAAEKVRHIEVAVKFYLEFYNQGWNGWLGPNPRDQLSRKLGHMLRHQLPIGYHPQIQTLRSQYAHYRFCQQAIIQGRLFKAGTELKDGVWLRENQLTKEQRSQLSYIEKANWLVPQLAPFMPLPDPLRYPVMAYQEGCQIMLVPESWPEL